MSDGALAISRAALNMIIRNLGILAHVFGSGVLSRSMIPFVSVVVPLWCAGRSSSVVEFLDDSDGFLFISCRRDVSEVEQRSSLI